MRTLLLILVGYLIFRLVRPHFPTLTIKKTDENLEEKKSSLDIRDEDIQDADYKDLKD